MRADSTVYGTMYDCSRRFSESNLKSGLREPHKLLEANFREGFLNKISLWFVNVMLNANVK